jgi:glyoxylase-like metal-dependent hydrolase (beta-lactamase superfamily II)
MLVREPSGRNVLLEAGIGAFFDPKMKARFGVVEDSHVLVDSLAKRGLRPSDIDVVVLSHLHFDHAGGVLSGFEEGKPLSLVFDRARYVVGSRAWDRAKKPHSRDKASFIPELLPLLEATSRVELVAEGAPNASMKSTTLGDAYSFTYSEGHTPGLMLTRVEGHANGAITFLGDLIPGAPWVHLPITMGYDRFPELLIDEKKKLLDDVIRDHGWLFFTHDPTCAAARAVLESAGEKAEKYGVREKIEHLEWS